MVAVAATAILSVGCKPAGEAGGTTPAANPTAEAGGTPTAAVRPAVTAKGNEAAGDTIKLGIVGSMGGDLRPWGVDSVDGAKLAVKEFNELGGLNGKKVELLVEDSNSRPEQGKSAAEKLIQDGAIGVMGEVASGITIQIAQSAFDKGIPVVAIGATRDDISDVGNNFFRVCYTDSFQGPVMAKFAFDELSLKNIALMTDKSQPYSTGLSDSFRKKFEALGGTIADEQFYQSKETQFGGQLTNLKAKNPDGIFLSGYFTEVGQIARQAREAGIKATFLGGDGWDSQKLLTIGGDAILGGFFCNHYNNTEARPEVKSFMDKWSKEYGNTPGTTMGALGYDAATLMLDALKRATAANSAALIVALEDTTDFKSVTGSITLKGRNGNPAKRALVVEVKKPTGQVARKSYEFDQVMQ